MDKFRRYLAVIFCLLLLVLFIPTSYPPNDSESGYGSEHPAHLTPFDRTVITRLVLWSSPDWKLWRYATSYLNTCAKDKRFDQGPYGRHVGLCSEFGLAMSLPSSTYYWKIMPDLLELEPSLLEKRDAAREADQRSNDAYDRLHKTKEYQELNDVAGRAIATYLDSVKSSLATKIYSINAGLLAFILLGIRYRQALGGLLWMPFSLIGGLFIRSAKMAKGLHDRV